MKDGRVFLQHSRDAIEKIEAYTAVGRDTFMAASHWQVAMIVTQTGIPELKAQVVSIHQALDEEQQ